MISLSTPLQGMEAASGRVNTAARRIAQAANPQSGDSVDLSAEAVAMMEAKTAFEANVNAAKTMDRMTGTLLNVLG